MDKQLEALRVAKAAGDKLVKFGRDEEAGPAIDVALIALMEVINLLSQQSEAPVAPEGWQPVPIEPTNAIIKAMAESKARDDEGEFPSLSDLIDFSGENKTYEAIKAAYGAAMLSAAPQPTTKGEE